MSSCEFPNERHPFFARHAWLARLLIVGSLVLLAATSYSLLKGGTLRQVDQNISDRFSNRAGKMPVGMISGFTRLADFTSIGPSIVCLIFCYRYLRRKCDDRFLLLLMSYEGGLLLFWLIALSVNRTRPSLPGLLSEFPFPSYPSGHLIQTITILAPLLYLYLPGVRSAEVRWLILLASLLLTMLIGYDRLILKAHYMTDLLAGVAVGIAWAVSVLVGFERYHLRLGHSARTDGTNTAKG